MAKLTRQLHERISGDNTENKDWWRLVFDTEAQRFYIEHEWRHTDAWRAARSNNGTAEFDINGFLAEGEAQAQAELLRIIESLFKKGAARMPRGAQRPAAPRLSRAAGRRTLTRQSPSLGAAAAPRGNARACFRFGSLTDLTTRSRRVGSPKSRHLSVGINVCKVPKTAFPARSGKQPRRGRWPGTTFAFALRSLAAPQGHLPATHEEVYDPSSGV